MCLMASQWRAQMGTLQLLWERVTMNPSRKTHLPSKRILWLILGLFEVKVGHQTRECTLCLTQVLVCQMETAAAIATKALLLCIVQQAKVLRSPLHHQVSSQSDLQALAAGCEGRTLKKLGVPFQQQPDLLLACQLQTPDLEPVTAQQDQSVMMRAWQAHQLFLTICRQHSLQEIKHGLTVPQSSAREHQKKMVGQLQRSAFHFQSLRIWSAAVVLQCAHSSPRLTLSTAPASKVPLDPLGQIDLQFLPLVAMTAILVMRLHHQMDTLFQGPTDSKWSVSKVLPSVPMIYHSPTALLYS